MKPFAAFFAVLFLLAPAALPAQLPLARASAGAQFDQITMIAFSHQLQRDKITQMIQPATVDSLCVRRVMPSLPKPDKKQEKKSALQFLASGRMPAMTQVIVAFEITKDGRVRHPLAVSGPRDLQPYALAAVRQWTFKPYISAQGLPTDVGTVYAMNLSSR